MKLVNRKTRKVIQKSIRKAMKKHGRVLMASLASALASSVATLANTDAPAKHGRSNLGNILEQTKKSLSQNGGKKSRARHSKKKRKFETDQAGQRQAAVT